MHAGDEILKVEVTQPDPGHVTIRCAGELEMSNCDRLIEAIDSTFTPDLRVLRVEAGGVTFMDSTGLHCLLRAERRCTEIGVRFELVPSKPVLRLLRLVGFDQHVSVIESGGGDGATT